MSYGCCGLKSSTSQIVTDCSVNVYNGTVLIKLHTKQVTQNEDQTNGCNRPLVTCWKSERWMKNPVERWTAGMCVGGRGLSRHSPAGVQVQSVLHQWRHLCPQSPDIHPLWKCYHFNLQSPPSSDRHSFWHKNKCCLTSNKPCRKVCVWERNMTDNINYSVNNSVWTEVFLLHEELDVVKHCIQMYKLFT